MLDFYNTHKDRFYFGNNWCGPDTLPHAQRILVARYPADKTDDPAQYDGQVVEVTCSV